MKTTILADSFDALRDALHIVIHTAYSTSLFNELKYTFLIHVVLFLCSAYLHNAFCSALSLKFVICRFLRFHRRRHLVVSTCGSLETVRVGLKIPQDGNRANKYGHLYAVRGHVWRTLCSVCATGARVAHPVPCNS